jgi:hypothetical protein
MTKARYKYIGLTRKQLDVTYNVIAHSTSESFLGANDTVRSNKFETD